MDFLYFAVIVLCLISFAEGTSFNGTAKIYMDVKIHRKPIGRIVFALFGDEAPRTVENFRQICVNGINGKTYVGTKFHRIVDRFMIQGGDIVSGDGRGSISIYGDYFEDENTSIEHTGSGFLAMANRGPNTNGCQFYITTMAAPWLNGKHTVFGKVIDGEGVVHTIEKTKTDTDDKPVKKVIITACGEIPVTGKFVISDEIYGIWNWIQAAGVPVGMSFTILAIFHYFIRKLNVLS